MKRVIALGAPCVLAGLALVAGAHAACADVMPSDTAATGVPAARAGTLDEVAPGTLMRISSRGDSRTIVWTRRPMFRASLLSVTEDSLRVIPAGAERTLGLARAEACVEVRAGRSHFNGIWTGAALGLLTGFAAGTVGAIVYKAGSDDEMADLAFLVFPILASTFTVPIGAVIGGISGVDRWVSVN